MSWAGPGFSNFDSSSLKSNSKVFVKAAGSVLATIAGKGSTILISISGFQRSNLLSKKDDNKEILTKF